MSRNGLKVVVVGGVDPGLVELVDRPRSVPRAGSAQWWRSRTGRRQRQARIPRRRGAPGHPSPTAPPRARRASRSSSPPCSSKPTAAAIASRTVDLPLPLSPASSVTGCPSANRSMLVIAGRSNGNPLPQDSSRSKPSSGRPGLVPPPIPTRRHARTVTRTREAPVGRPARTGRPTPSHGRFPR